MKFLVYLVSLKKDEARRKKLKDSFLSYSSFNTVDAVDGRELDAKSYYSYMIKAYKKHNLILTPSEVGCTLSHINALKMFLDTDLDFALILEDDVIGSDEDIKKAFELCKFIDKDSVFICGCQDGLVASLSSFGKRLKEQKDIFLVSGFSYRCMYRTASYIVTRSSAKKLLDTFDSELCPADFWNYLLKSSKLQMYFCDIFSHPIELSSSNIESERIDKKGEKISLKAYFDSFLYILFTRFQKYFCGYEKMIKS